MVIFIRAPAQPSRRKIELLGPPRRISLPGEARRALPVELARAEPAVVALVAREPPRLPLHEVAHQLEIVATLGRRGEELRLEQPVEAEERGVAPQLVADERVGGLRALRVERRLERHVEQIERRVLREIAAQ